MILRQDTVYKWEVFKMVNALSSVNAAGTNSAYNAAQTKTNQQDEAVAQQAAASTNIVNVSSTPEVSVATKTSDAENNISPAYSVEISEEGAQLSAAASTNAETGAPTDKPVPPAGKPANPPAGSPKTTSTTKSDSSDSSTTDLSQYSESQLKEMLTKGKITQDQYAAEMASRKQEQQAGVSTTEVSAKVAGSAIDAVN
jgi:hypothetical protein